MSENNQKNPENRGENRENHGNRNSGGHKGNYHHSKNYHNRGKRNGNPSSNKENFAQRETGRNIADDPVKRSIQAQNSAASSAGEPDSRKKPNNAEQGTGGKRHKGPYQKNHSRENGRPHSGAVKVEETREDIIRDLGRIEKEIELEIKEISALQFGI